MFFYHFLEGGTAYYANSLYWSSVIALILDMERAAYSLWW